MQKNYIIHDKFCQLYSNLCHLKIKSGLFFKEALPDCLNQEGIFLFGWVTR